ncbi:uncharacterized protein [Littorina saxatilis]|uniref:uncharacterized protein n=1 Tax=Littorina saxatilis TaxID=31220 RepID=UPI0038B5B0D6
MIPEELGYMQQLASWRPVERWKIHQHHLGQIQARQKILIDLIRFYLACEGNTYGKDCKEECGLCSNLKPCNVFNGTCEACYKELTLPMCKDHSETSDAGSLAGPIAGAVVGGFCLLGLSVLVVGLCLSRAWSARSAEQVQSTTATNHEEQPSVEMTTSTETNVDVTVGERGDYDSLQYGTDDRSPYDTPVFAKQSDVYENADLDTKE